MEKNKCQYSPFFTCWHVNWVAGITKSSSISPRSEFLQVIKDRLLMLIFMKLIYLTNEAYFEFIALVFEYIYLTVRELCHHQNPFWFTFLRQHTIYIYIYLSSSPFILYCCDSLWNAAGGCWWRHSTKQMCSAAVSKRTHDTVIPVLVHGCSVNETFHFRKNKKVSIT